MAKKRSKKTKKSSRKRIKPSKRRFIWPLLLGVILAATLGGTLFFVFLSPGTNRQATVHKPQLAQTGKNRPDSGQARGPLPYEEDALPVAKQRSTSRSATVAPAGSKPRLALLIDDMGYQQKPGQELIDMDLNLSFAILPFTPHGHGLMEIAQARKREILLHLPMEATAKKWDPGPGTLSTSMAAGSIKAQLRKDLADIPLAVGVNNHMGSKFTSNRKAMQAVLATLKARDLFFLDSITIASSVAYDEARKMHIKTGRRDIFLDNDQDEAKIKTQLEKVVALARKQGSAIAIAHPHPATIATLKKESAWLKQQVELVPVSSLME